MTSRHGFVVLQQQPNKLAVAGVGPVVAAGVGAKRVGARQPPRPVKDPQSGHVHRLTASNSLWIPRPGSQRLSIQPPPCVPATVRALVPITEPLRDPLPGPCRLACRASSVVPYLVRRTGQQWTRRAVAYHLRRGQGITSLDVLALTFAAANLVLYVRFGCRAARPGSAAPARPLPSCPLSPGRPPGRAEGRTGRAPSTVGIRSRRRRRRGRVSTTAGHSGVPGTLSTPTPPDHPSERPKVREPCRPRLRPLRLGS
jgi:hypothetical protein